MLTVCACGASGCRRMPTRVPSCRPRRLAKVESISTISGCRACRPLVEPSAWPRALLCKPVHPTNIERLDDLPSFLSVVRQTISTTTFCTSCDNTVSACRGTRSAASTDEFGFNKDSRERRRQIDHASAEVGERHLCRERRVCRPRGARSHCSESWRNLARLFEEENALRCRARAPQRLGILDGAARGVVPHWAGPLNADASARVAARCQCAAPSFTFPHFIA